MTNQQHPITPPPELVEQWMQSHSTKYDLARQAAQWGADQELEACCEWVKKVAIVQIAENLRTARRPKPPSLKEQALVVLDKFSSGELVAADKMVDTIRRALEALPNE